MHRLLKDSYFSKWQFLCIVFKILWLKSHCLLRSYLPPKIKRTLIVEHICIFSFCSANHQLDEKIHWWHNGLCFFVRFLIRSLNPHRIVLEILILKHIFLRLWSDRNSLFYLVQSCIIERGYPSDDAIDVTFSHGWLYCKLAWCVNRQISAALITVFSWKFGLKHKTVTFESDRPSGLMTMRECWWADVPESGQHQHLL